MIQTLITIAISILISFGVISAIPAKAPQNLGTAPGSTISYTKDLLPITDNAYDLGTSTKAYRNGWINSLTVNSCSGCSSSSESQDLQDVYNIATGDGEILTANNKNIVFALANTVTNANFIIDNMGSQGSLLFNTSSTTMAIITGYGQFGIGTTTPGAAFGVNASTTILGDNAYLFGPLTLNYLWATSTTATSTFGGDGQGGADGTSISQSIISGNLLDIGIFKATSTTATSTANLLTINTNLLTTNLRVIGSPTFDLALEVVESATSSFQGGISIVAAGGLASAQGLTITGGDIQSSGKLTVTSAATSTFSGGISSLGLASSGGLTITAGHILSTGKIEITGVGTSTLAGGLTASSSLAITGKVVASPRGACQSTGLLNFGEANGGCLAITVDTTISVENALPNQVYTLWLYHDAALSNIAWASSTNGYVFHMQDGGDNGKATTTSDGGNSTLDICSFRVGPTSTPTMIGVICSPAFKPI